jgi:hypothetical protein
MLKLWSFWFQLFLPFYRAGDSCPKCVFAIFVQSFGLEPPGIFVRPETPALGSGDSGRHNFWSGARLCIGLGVFLTLGRRLGAGDSGPQAGDSGVSAQQ